MPVVSSDQLQLAIVEEVTPGVTPASPSFMLVRTSGESVTFTSSTSASAELTGSGGRCQRPANITGQSIGGDISFELAPAPWFDAALGGVLAAEWGECPLTGAAGGAIGATEIVVGKDARTFTIEKRFPDPDTPGSYFYQWYKGATFSNMQINIVPNETVTGTVSVVGGEPELGTGTDAAPGIPGSTYASAGDGAVFTAPNVSELTVGSDLDIGTNCWTSVTIGLDSQNRGIPCIGSNGDREVVLGTLAASLVGEVYFNDQDILQAMLDNQVVGDAVIILNNADSDVLRFDFFSTKPTAATVVASGTQTDVVMPLTLEPDGVTVCDDAGATWSSCVLISKTAAGPVLPTMLFADDLSDGRLMSV